MCATVVGLGYTAYYSEGGDADYYSQYLQCHLPRCKFMLS
jgi:hypothetical protein